MTTIETSVSDGILATEQNPVGARKFFRNAAIGLLGTGAVVELYATAAIADERVPGDAAMFVGAGVLCLVSAVGASLASMPQSTAASSAAR